VLIAGGNRPWLHKRSDQLLESPNSPVNTSNARYTIELRPSQPGCIEASLKLTVRIHLITDPIKVSPMSAAAIPSEPQGNFSG
jgi:hypothetical protein